MRGSNGQGHGPRRWLPTLVFVFIAQACTPGLRAPSDLGLFGFSGLFQNEFIIGGSTLGLSGNLTIALNDGADMTLRANGDFTFPGSLTRGAVYLVVIRAQPSNPREYCSVDAGSGIALNNVNTIRVSCFQLPDTGQTQCSGSSGGLQSCGGIPAGQDADYTGTPAALEFLTMPGREAVRETASVLLWQRCPFGTSFDGTQCAGTALTHSLASAQSYCAGLTLEGETWRLPTMRELLLWTNYSRNFPAAQTAIFSGIPLGSPFGFWSSTADSLNPGLYHILDSDTGATANEPATNSGHTRCVSGPAMPGNLFSDRGDGTIYDQSTNLLWTKCALSSFGPPGTANTSLSCAGGTPPTDTWAVALNACDTLTAAGRTDWRLPSVRELATLLDFNAGAAPVIDTSFFVNNPGGSFWTSTWDDTTSADAWLVNFSNFTLTTTPKSNDVFARCVATGP